MANTKKIVRSILIILIIAAGIIWVCAHFFHLGNVEWTDNAQVRRNIVPINSRVQGYIERICFNDFEEVHKGDTLVVIENSEHLLRVAQANAAYQRSLVENTAMGTTISTTENNLSVSDAAIDELKVRLLQAETDYKRYEQLLAQKAVTRQQYENMKTNYDALKAKYDMLVRQKNSTRLVKAEQTQRLDQRKADIEAAEAALELAQLNLSYTVITAPCDGIASKKNIQVGQLIQPGQNLLSLVETDKVWVVANYKETQMKNIKDGMPVKIVVDAVPDVNFNGVVTSISGATGAQYSPIPVDNATGNFVKVKQRVPVRIDFSDKNSPEALKRLSSGMNVVCEVIY
ncbi:MAG: HlyD family secretion protein [Bacteroidales bacterium]|nr:HlyD family secretion protein [Bacteroidales bacterium]